MIELNEKNLKELLDLRKKDMIIRDKWTEFENGELVVIVPETKEEFVRFIQDWLPVCPLGTEERIKKIKKEMKSIAKKNSYVFEEKHLLIMTAREIARIKKEYSNEQVSLANRADKKYGASGHGFTYLAEISDLMETFLESTQNDYPKAISIYEGKRIRRTV